MPSKLKFLSECSTEALLEVFDPAYQDKLNCIPADAVLRHMALELIERGVVNMQDIPQPIRKAVVGPERCPHGIRMEKADWCDECQEELGFKPEDDLVRGR